ncbi:hypothetical protein QQS21_001526 [Conoideocrella luteorostrata]|uniref:Uncharacterized protein n=1 Tax=Conoideocrella luteorostrata TaxID=1105319 RepID=A0AAJ0CWS3_9HYPO|nr:hypothetical protein QQS21_001526 [Conoideocrella luteorostrata]
MMQTDMASSLGSTRDCTPVTTNKHIPLLCTVCPETPRFSDVSHLLTHIASKGHLHHETQTKLKAHQDIAASVILQQYERWYKDNGIETLLVERMRAKQKKEAIKTSRTRDSTPFASSKLRRKSRRVNQRATVKAEQEDFPREFPLFPGFFPSDNDLELDEESVGSDMMSLKGQVWPGMGKMDLANEDMKRTRNQRKPNSVIEKMKRISEGIEPTQVVMTPDLEIERVKGVYDSSSPIPGQEAEFKTPKRSVRPKRKRAQPLAEISVNVPRRACRRPGRRNAASKGKPMPMDPTNDGLTPMTSTSNMNNFRQSGQDVFRDNDDGVSGMMPLSVSFLVLTMIGIYGDRLFAAPSSHHDQRFDARSRFGLHPYGRVSHSPLISPTPPSRDVPPRLLPLRNTTRIRDPGAFYDNYNGQPNFTPVSLSSASYGVNDPSVYNYSPRLSFPSCSNLSASGNDIFRFNMSHHLQQKQEGNQSPTQREVAHERGNPQFLHISESNPLFTQDRALFGAYNSTGPIQPLSALNLEPLHQIAEHTHAPTNDQEIHGSSSRNVKMEAQFKDMVDNEMPGECKASSFTEHEVWASTEALDL